MITCRVCEGKSQPYPDAVLLCGDCRSQSDTLVTSVTATYETAGERTCTTLLLLSLDDLQRVKVADAAYWAAVRNNTLAQWERRIQATIAQGGLLADYLEARLAYLRIKAWYKAAMEELAAYADEQLEAA